jgi:hypothetical protein
MFNIQSRFPAPRPPRPRGLGFRDSPKVKITFPPCNVTHPFSHRCASRREGVTVSISRAPSHIRHLAQCVPRQGRGHWRALGTASPTAASKGRGHGRNSGERFCGRPGENDAQTMYRGERNVNRDRRGGPGVGPRDPASVPGKGKSPERKLVGNELPRGEGALRAATLSFVGSVRASGLGHRVV